MNLAASFLSWGHIDSLFLRARTSSWEHARAALFLVEIECCGRLFAELRVSRCEHSRCLVSCHWSHLVLVRLEDLVRCIDVLLMAQIIRIIRAILLSRARRRGLSNRKNSLTDPRRRPGQTLTVHCGTRLVRFELLLEFEVVLREGHATGHRLLGTRTG